jgi:uncharacterized membrane protein
VVLVWSCQQQSPTLSLCSQLHLWWDLCVLECLGSNGCLVIVLCVHLSSAVPEQCSVPPYQWLTLLHSLVLGSSELGSLPLKVKGIKCQSTKLYLMAYSACTWSNHIEQISYVWKITAHSTACIKEIFSTNHITLQAFLIQSEC